MQPSRCSNRDPEAREALPFIHTNSAVNCYQQCPQLFDHKYVSLRRPAKVASALAMGSAFGALVDGIWGAEELEDHPPLSDVERAKVAAMIAAYREIRAPWIATLTDVEIEHQWSEEIAGKKCSGKIDKRFREAGQLCMLDHKTIAENVSDATSDYWDHMLMNRQAALYRAATYLETGEVPRIYWDVIRKPSLRLKKTETPEEYSQRCLDAYREAPDDFFTLREVVFTEEMANQAVSEFLEIADEIDTRRSLARNPGACRKFGSACPFLGVCIGRDSLDDPKFEIIDSPHAELNTKEGIPNA